MRTLLVFSTLFVSVLGFAPADPCTRLCARDGPSVCTKGSWTKPNGACQSYLFRGDASLGDYCYHTPETASVCPSGGASVTATDALHLLGNDSSLRGTQATTTSSPDVGVATHHLEPLGPEPATAGEPGIEDLPELGLMFIERLQREVETGTQAPRTELDDRIDEFMGLLVGGNLQEWLSLYYGAISEETSE